MKLNYKETGEGHVVFILHGLLGMSDNWVSIAKILSKKYRVFNIDIRNHGLSPHSDNMNYDLMADDLFEIVKDRSLNKVSLIGHSMGGKIAIIFADKYRDFVEKLIVIDICHRSYEHIKKYNRLMNVISRINLMQFKSRIEIDNHLKIIFPADRTIGLLQKNIKRNNDNTFSWKFNHVSIKNNLKKIGKETIPEKPLDINVLFIKGELSDYITKEDEEDIKIHFINSKVEIIKEASHWINADQPQLLTDTIINFLDN